MRVTSAAATDVANQQGEPKVYWDYLFRDVKDRELVSPKLGCSVADTHAHLDMLHYPALSLARCAAHGVDFVVTVVDPTEDPHYTYAGIEDWKAAAGEILSSWGLDVVLPHIRVSIGCHPHNASKYAPEIERLLIECAGRPISSAIGEIGLDYHYDMSPRQVQREVFRRQLALANEMKLPVSLHLREAHDDGLNILAEEGVPAAGTLLHCFNLDFDALKPFLELDCYVAYGGPLTFKKCNDVRDAARQTPIDRILTETDAPFMAPDPKRGTICGPEDTLFIAAKLAEVHAVEGPDAAHLLARVFENARDFFDREPVKWQLGKHQSIHCTPSCAQFAPALPMQTAPLLQVEPPHTRTDLEQIDPQFVAQAINRHFP